MSFSDGFANYEWPVVKWDQQRFDVEAPRPRIARTRYMTYHQPVLVEPVVELLAPGPGKTLVDCTVGTGGHSLAVLPHLMPTGRMIAVDRDRHALEKAQPRLAEFSPHVRFVHDHFGHLPGILSGLGVEKVDGILVDLGISSLHVDEAARGFSFLKDGPLDMRMDQRQELTATDLVQRMSEHDLEYVLETYGEERWARRIAKQIVLARKRQLIETTTQLARIVAGAVPSRGSSHRIHPATRTFQALRIAVNDELGCLKKLLEFLPEVLLRGGRAAIISFHSLEDRMVKHAFQEGARAGMCRVLTKKPLRATDDEVEQNPRSRSAKLRAIERL